MGTNWKDKGELIGIIAIVLSLAFVGFQLQQDRDIAVAQLITDAEMKQIELSNLISSHSSLWVRGLQGEELTTDDEVIFQAIVHAVTVKYGSMTVRTNRGLLSRSGGIQRQFALHIYANPGFRRVWQARCESYKIISDSNISGCERINLELKKIEDGTLPPFAFKFWSL